MGLKRVKPETERVEPVFAPYMGLKRAILFMENSYF